MSKKCISCGAELAEDAAFCPYCETAQEEKRPAGMPRVRRKKGLRWAAAILAAAVVTGGIPNLQSNTVICQLIQSFLLKYKQEKVIPWPNIH